MALLSRSHAPLGSEVFCLFLASARIVAFNSKSRIRIEPNSGIRWSELSTLPRPLPAFAGGERRPNDLSPLLN